MKLTVDASVAIKWFVAESKSGEARLFLAERIQLHAPGLLLAEFANTIWKKTRRGEISDARPYLNELAGLSELISIYPAGVLIERAAQFAFQIDHPIYDCLYLACAEFTDSALITADKRQADKVGDQLPGVLVHYIGAPATVRWLETGIAAAAGTRIAPSSILRASDADRE